MTPRSGAYIGCNKNFQDPQLLPSRGRASSAAPAPPRAQPGAPLSGPPRLSPRGAAGDPRGPRPSEHRSISVLHRLLNFLSFFFFFLDLILERRGWVGRRKGEIQTMGRRAGLGGDPHSPRPRPRPGPSPGRAGSWGPALAGRFAA